MKEHEVILVIYLSFDFASNPQNLNAYARESGAGNLFFCVILLSCQIGLLHISKNEARMAYEWGQMTPDHTTCVACLLQRVLSDIVNDGTTINLNIRTFLRFMLLASLWHFQPF